jgi:hypothetical protein
MRRRGLCWMGISEGDDHGLQLWRTRAGWSVSGICVGFTGELEISIRIYGVIRVNRLQVLSSRSH